MSIYDRLVGAGASKLEVWPLLASIREYTRGFLTREQINLLFNLDELESNDLFSIVDAVANNQDKWQSIEDAVILAEFSCGFTDQTNSSRADAWSSCVYSSRSSFLAHISTILSQ